MLGSGQGGYVYPAVLPPLPQRRGAAILGGLLGRVAADVCAESWQLAEAIRSLNLYTAAVREELLAGRMTLYERQENE